MKKIDEFLSELKNKEKIRVLFVCLGNICRSPAAEGMFKAILEERGEEGRWVVDSAGTAGLHAGELPDRRMRLHARQRGIDLTHTCRRVVESDFDDFDIIIPMDAQNLADLRRKAPTLEAARKLVPMATFIDSRLHYDYVPDPYYEGAEGFELVLDLLDNSCRNLADLRPGIGVEVS